jgi:hypothetical protein
MKNGESADLKEKNGKNVANAQKKSYLCICTRYLL